MTEEDTGSAIRRDRFSGGPARSFLSSMADDERLFEADLAVDRAHVVMLAEQGIVPAETAGRILEAVDEIEVAGYDSLPAGEDVHEAIETAVIEQIGDEGGRMHTARSRNDEVATCIRYRLREELLDLSAAMIDLRAALVATADVHAETLMPGYTHLQPAQPTTLGHYALSYEGPLARDTARVLECYTRVNQSPLGGAAFAGTPFDIDRDRTATLLGFDGLVTNAMDAVSSRDALVEAMAATSTVATSLSGIAEDAILFSHRGFLTLSDEYASTSSIMPQKKNPDTLELTRAVAGEAMGTLVAVLGTLKGLPRAYNRDLQRGHPDVFETIARVAEATRVAAGAIETATWHEEALASAAAEGNTTVTGVADLLAANGMPFRTAHEIVARGVELANEADGSTTGTDEKTPLVEGFAAAAREVLGSPGLEEYADRDDLERVLDPTASVESRDSTGGPAPAAVEEHRETVAERLDGDRETVADRRTDLAEAAAALEQEVGRYA